MHRIASLALFKEKSMSTDESPGDAQLAQPSRPLLLFGELLAICLPALVAGALTEHWFGSDDRTWGSAAGAILGLAVVCAVAWKTKRQGNMIPWLIAVGFSIGNSNIPIGRSQSLDTEFGRFLGLATGTAVLVLGLWALTKLTSRAS